MLYQLSYCRLKRLSGNPICAECPESAIRPGADTADRSGCDWIIDDFTDAAGADGAAALADGEAHGLFHGDRGDQLDFQIRRCRRA